MINSLFSNLHALSPMLPALMVAALAASGCGPSGGQDGSGPAGSGQERAGQEGSAEYAPFEPVRGVWLTNIDSEILFSDSAAARAIDRVADAGFNTVYPVVWNDGYTLHPSDLMARTFGEAFRQDTVFAAQGRDPLAVVIREARRRGLRVIPWFEFGFSSSYRQGGGHILAAKPEWAARDSAGGILTKNGFEWMNALHPDVRAFLIELVMEVARGYDVDGIQGDDRMPAMPSEGGYSEFTRRLHLEQTGRPVPDEPREPAFLQWKADRLTEFAVELHRAVKAHDPSLTVSFSPSIHPWSKEEYLQDWPAWIAAGAVDELIPQAYRWDIASYRRTIDDMVETFLAAPGHERVTLQPGIIIKAGDRFNGWYYVSQALSHNRSRGLTGEVYFFYEGLFEQNGFLADSLRSRMYASEPDRPPQP